jgi:hypothetical protein
MEIVDFGLRISDFGFKLALGSNNLQSKITMDYYSVRKLIGPDSR